MLFKHAEEHSCSTDQSWYNGSVLCFALESVWTTFNQVLWLFPSFFLLPSLGWSDDVAAHKPVRTYRGVNKGLYVLLSRIQAEPGRTVKQEQEEIYHNHVQTFIYLSVRRQSTKSWLLLHQTCTYSCMPFRHYTLKCGRANTDRGCNGADEQRELMGSSTTYDVSRYLGGGGSQTATNLLTTNTLGSGYTPRSVYNGHPNFSTSPVLKDSPNLD